MKDESVGHGNWQTAPRWRVLKTRRYVHRRVGFQKSVRHIHVAHRYNNSRAQAH